MKAVSLGSIFPWGVGLALCLVASSALSEIPQQYGYTGREPDASGLVYYRSRYYDPGVSTFTQRDPIGLAGGTNDYAYVSGNPLVALDPMGTDSGGGPGFFGRMGGHMDSLVAGAFNLVAMMGRDSAAQAAMSAGLPPDYASLPADEQNSVAEVAMRAGLPVTAVTGAAIAVASAPVTLPVIGALAWKNSTAFAGGFLYGATSSYLNKDPWLQVAFNGVGSGSTAVGIANAGAFCGGPSLCLAGVRTLWGAHSLVMQEGNAALFGNGLKPIGDLNAYSMASTMVGGHLLMYPPYVIGWAGVSRPSLGAIPALVYGEITLPYLALVDRPIRDSNPVKDWTLSWALNNVAGGVMNYVGGGQTSTKAPSTP